MGKLPRRPVIGAICYGKGRDPERFIFPVSYVDAVRKAGGQLIIFPPGEEPPAALLGLVDGLLLAGGGDLDPAHYQQDPHPMLYGQDPVRDAQELSLIPAALTARVPILAICRGLQAINVALGGSLHQHLPDVYGEQVAHRGNEERRHLPHGVRLAAHSQLAEVLGARSVVVASAHHQAIQAPGRGVIPVAWAEDGVIEAAELEGHPQVLAVQWHPEERQDAAQCRLFQWFTQRAKLYQDERA